MVAALLAGMMVWRMVRSNIQRIEDIDY